MIAIYLIIALAAVFIFVGCFFRLRDSRMFSKFIVENYTNHDDAFIFNLVYRYLTCTPKEVFDDLGVFITEVEPLNKSGNCRVFKVFKK